jgi:plastocyanin
MMSFSSAMTRALFPALVATAGMLSVSAAVAATPAPKQTVQIHNFAFVPQIIVVKPGTMVVWTNADEDPHTVTSTDKSFHSSAMDTRDTFSFTFAKPGDFAYFCALHPHMTGKVIVKG